METKIEGEQNITQEDKAEAFEFLGKIHGILAHIREGNEGLVKSHEQVRGQNAQEIERVAFPPEGGVYTFYKGNKLPSRGFPYDETVEAVDDCKKIVMAFVYSFYNILKKPLSGMLFLFFFRKQIQEIFLRVPTITSKRLRGVLNKPTMYSPAIREVYRVLSDMSEIENGTVPPGGWKLSDTTLKSVMPDIRDVVCMSLDNDDAYRYRFQDIMVEMDKVALKKNTRKEILRLLGIVEKRELSFMDTFGYGFQGRKWERMRRVASVALLIPALQKRAFYFLNSLDIEKLRMDEIDLESAYIKTSYDFKHEK